MIDVDVATSIWLPDLEFQAWERGRSHQLHLDVGQAKWTADFDAASDFGVWMIARQRGKSFAALFADVMFCQRTKGAIARYLGQTKESAQAIAGPTLDQIFALCPDKSLLPWPYNKNGSLGDNYELHWPHNGASLTISGTDNESFRRQRGPRSHRITFDEAAFYAKLEEVEGALLPSLQTTGGKPLYLSTPPLSPGHPFVARYRAAQAAGTAKHETIHQNPRLTEADVMAIARREGVRLGMSLEELLASTYWRREYLAEIVVEESRAAVPAWTDEVALECTREWGRPSHFHGYTAHDWGGYEGDPHAALFGYLDFKASKLIIQDESEVRGVDTRRLTEIWKAKEVALWGERSWDGTLWGAGEFERNTKELPDFLKKALADSKSQQPYLRVCDNDEQLQGDMMSMGYAMFASRKDDKHLAVDALNVLVRERRIIIHPRCRRLLEQLRTALWNRTRSEWERTAKDHSDLVDCAVYMARNIFWNSSPFPAPKPDYWGQPVRTGYESLAGAMTGRRR